MTQEQIIEGNKLIAEFMGATFNDDGTWDEYPKIPNHFEVWGNKIDDQIHYHDEWSWLMPVIEKMCKMEIVFEDIKPEDFQTYYPRTFGMINNDTMDFMVRINGNPLHEASTLIEATYSAVIQLLKWLNDKK